jgi:cellobiose phosphorylase
MSTKIPRGETASNFGHYDDAAREYVVTDPRTPTKWVNYIGTLDFGGFVDQTGGLNICKKDPANNRITGYKIDTPQNAMRGNTLYCRIQNADGTYTVFSPFFTPTLTPYDKFECRMGLGYNKWIVRMNGLEFEIKLFVPAGASQVVTDVKVRNISAPENVQVDVIPLVEFSHPDALKNLTNADWVPQTMKGKAVGNVITQYPHMAEGKRANFLTANRPMDSFTTDRNKFLGNHGYGTYFQPGGLMGDHLDNYEALRADNGNSIAAILYRLGSIARGQEARIITQLGQNTSVQAAANSIARFQDPKNVDAAFADLNTSWREYLDHLRDVETPDSGLNKIVNTLGPRQNHATFFWSRYLSLNQLGYGGDRGIGVRDTNQDLMGVLPYMPDKAREMIEKLLSVQRFDGSSMHQFNPLTMKASIGEGHAGTEQDFYSDDHLWNILSVVEYVKETGDTAFLNKVIGYYDEGTGEKKSGAVLEHLHRALAFTSGNLGRHGLPKLGWADWNDAFNMEGSESVFSACLYGKALLEMQELMDVFGDAKSAQGYAEEYDRIKKNVNKYAWDGEWYVSYIDKDGTPVGSKKNEEGQIYLYTQAWAVISGFASPNRAARAMQSVQEKLDTKHGIKVMTPAYRQMQPGISASTYTPGLKENAGVFLHPNPWAAIAETMLGHGERAVQIIDRINPLKKDTKTYECQPDVFVQNIASDEHPQFGLARNPWLSGTVSWVNQATTKNILGIRPTYKGLMIDPSIPERWPGYTATRVFRGVACNIRVERGDQQDGNPQRVSSALGTAPPTAPPLAALGLAKPSREATLPAKPAGSARDQAGTVMIVNGNPVEGNVVPTTFLSGKAEVEIVVKLGTKPAVPLIEKMSRESESRRAAAVAAQDHGPLNRDELHTISGAQAKVIYLFSRMLVHAQGLSATLDFPPTGVVTGAPTLATGISPFGQVNHLLDAGRSIRFGKRMRYASTPMICITQGGKTRTCLLTNLKREEEDEKGEEPQSYPDSIADEDVSVTLAPPSMMSRYELEGVRVARTTTSPELSGNENDVSVPATVDVFELSNSTDKERMVTLVVPRPSLVNLTEKKLRAEQDNAFSGQGATEEQVHEEYQSDTLRGVVMGSKKTGDRMVIAVPKMDGVDIDVQLGFRTAAYQTDLFVDPQGRFRAHKTPEPTFECGAAIAVTVKLPANGRVKLPFATVMDFSKQKYVDGKSFDRAYTKRFTDKKTRAVAMTEWALAESANWIGRTEAIQSRVFDIVRGDPGYANDRPAAMRVVNLLMNELSYLLSNAAIWIEQGVAEFLECFDYPFLNSADVDWYSQLMLMVFPEKEKAVCQKFIDSIGDQNDTEVYYHWHAANAKMRAEFEEWNKLKALVVAGRTLGGDKAARFEYLEHEADVGDGKKGYNGRSLTHIRGPKKLKGSVSHDVGRLTAGNPLRGNVSEYDWFNTNYWVDLFPKLAQRVARDAKFANDSGFVTKNWETLQAGFNFWIGLDRDGDGIPEGNPGEVKNTFDNIKLFGYDSYSASLALAGYKSMLRMAEMMLDMATTDAERSSLRAKIADYRAWCEKAKKTIEKLWVRTHNEDGTEGGYFATCYDPKVEAGDFAVYPQGGTLRAELKRGGYLRDDGSVDAEKVNTIGAPSTLELSPGFDKEAVLGLLKSYAGRADPNEIANLTEVLDKVGSVLDQLKKYRYADEDKGAIDRAKFEALADADAMKLSPFINKAYVHREMEKVLERTASVYPELARNGYIVDGEIQDKFWEVASAEHMEGNYSDCQAAFDALRVHKSFDVFTNQLDGLWAWIAMGEDPEELVQPARVQMILKTIYENNRVTNGWATQRTADGKEVESDQGKDVWIASNYVLAHILDCFGMTEESKDVYKVMDEVLLQHDNTSTSPESVRPDENKFIVKGYPRPGAVWTQLPLLFFKAQKRAGRKTSAPEEMTAFIQGIFNPDGSTVEAFRSRGQGKTESVHWGRKAGRIPYGLSRVRPGAGTGPIMPGGGGTAGSVLA